MAAVHQAPRSLPATVQTFAGKLGAGGGVAEISAWRANDVVEYELLRDAGAALTAALLSAARSDDSFAGGLRAEMVALRRELSSVSPYDRAAVTAMRQRVERRLMEFSVMTDE
jgi:hypothetical protein